MVTLLLMVLLLLPPPPPPPRLPLLIALVRACGQRGVPAAVDLDRGGEPADVVVRALAWLGLGLELGLCLGLGLGLG